MTKEAYFAILGKFKAPKNYYDLMCRPDYELARQGIYECTYKLGKYRDMEEKPRKEF